MVSIWMYFFDEIYDYIEVRGGFDFRFWIDYYNCVISMYDCFNIGILYNRLIK